jgi:Leucine-rich repeat (LRR) protein
LKVLCDTLLRKPDENMLLLSLSISLPKQVLDLSSNALNKLPQSISRLSSLQTLSVDRNRLSILPAFTLKRLSSLSAASNKISILPASIAECIELTTIDMTDNPLSKSVAVIVSKLPKLLHFKQDQIKTIKKKVSFA